MIKSSQIWYWQWRNHICEQALSVVTAIDHDSVEGISIYGTWREIILEILKSSLAEDYSEEVPIPFPNAKNLNPGLLVYFYVTFKLRLRGRAL
jgi:hypothetical protein